MSISLPHNFSQDQHPTTSNLLWDDIKKTPYNYTVPPSSSSCVSIFLSLPTSFFPARQKSNPQKSHPPLPLRLLPFFWMSLFGTFWCFHFYRHRFLHGQRHLLLHGGSSNGWNRCASVVQPRLLGCRPRNNMKSNWGGNQDLWGINGWL